MMTDGMFSKKQGLYLVSLSSLIQRVQERTIILREVNPCHVRNFKQYILSYDEKQPLYIPPLIGHLDEGELKDGFDGKISMIEGSHRLKGFAQLFETLEKKKNVQETETASSLLTMLKHTMITMQLYEGLQDEERDQLYVHLHTSESWIKYHVALNKSKGSGSDVNHAVSRKTPGKRPARQKTKGL